MRVTTDLFTSVLGFMEHKTVSRLLNQWNEYTKHVQIELNKLIRDTVGRPLFTNLGYEGFRPYNPNYSGARQIGIDFHDLHEPYMNSPSVSNSDSDSS